MSSLWSRLTGEASETWSLIVEAAGTALEFITKISRDLLNTWIGLYVGAFETILAVWNFFPSAVADLAIQATNAVIAAVEHMVNTVVNAVNRISGLLGIGEMQGVSLGRVDNPFAGSAGEMAGAVGGAFGDAMDRDFIGEGSGFLGELFAGVRARAHEIAMLRLEVEHTAATISQPLEFIESAFEQTAEKISKSMRGAADAIEDAAREAGAAADIMGLPWFKTTDAVVNSTGDMANQVLGIMNGFFEGNKVISAATALIATLVGQAEALRLPFPANLAAAAKVGAAGMGFIRAIQGASPGGSVSAPSAGSGAGVVTPAHLGQTVDTGRPAPLDVHITLQGDVFDRRMIEKLIKEINAASADGVRLRLS
jgi:hypothetical protein